MRGVGAKALFLKDLPDQQRGEDSDQLLEKLGESRKSCLFSADETARDDSVKGGERNGESQILQELLTADIL